MCGVVCKTDNVQWMCGVVCKTDDVQSMCGVVCKTDNVQWMCGAVCKTDNDIKQNILTAHLVIVQVWFVCKSTS